MSRSRLFKFAWWIVLLTAQCAILFWSVSWLNEQWRHFAKNPWFEKKDLPEHLGEATPIYATSQPVQLDDKSNSLRPDIEDNRARVLVAQIAMAQGVLVMLVLSRFRVPVLVRLLLAATTVWGINVAVARIRADPDVLYQPYLRRLEYFSDVPKVGDYPILFVRQYAGLGREATEQFKRDPGADLPLSLHAGTHPPGGVLFLWIGTRLFGDTAPTAAWWTIGFASLGVFPTYVLARLIGGPRAARWVLPLYLVTPNLVLFGATSLDSVYVVFLMTAIATGVWALVKPSIYRTILAGAALWLAAFMSFAAVAIPIVLALYTLLSGRRGWFARFAVLVCIGIGFITVQKIASIYLHYDIIAVAKSAMARDEAAMGTTGFETQHKWLAISVMDLAGFAFGQGVALTALFGIAILSALFKPFHRRSRFTLALAIALIALSFSTLFTFETERVWLFLTPAFLACVASKSQLRLVLIAGMVLLAMQTINTEIQYYTHW